MSRDSSGCSVKHSFSINACRCHAEIALTSTALVGHFRCVSTFRIRHSHAKCILASGHGRLCVCVCCVSVSAQRRIPTLLHASGCNLGYGRECPVLLGGFALNARFWLLWQHVHVMRNVSECSRTRCVAGCSVNYDRKHEVPFEMWTRVGLRNRVLHGAETTFGGFSAH